MGEEKREYWFVFQNDHLLVLMIDDSVALPAHDAVALLKPYFVRQHFIGEWEGTSLLCAELDTTFVLPEDFSLLTLRKALECLGNNLYVMTAKAFSIINWDRNHQFCGRCGNPTIYQHTLFERTCPACGMFYYPRISPSVIVLIQKGEEILMARSPHFPKGAYGLVAGFIEPGESAEAAVHREVQEEVGIKIKNLRYFGSQAWPFPDSLMFGFTAEYESGELVIDHTEIEDAGWYHYSHLPGRPSSPITIATKLIDYFISVQESKKN